MCGCSTVGLCCVIIYLFLVKSQQSLEEMTIEPNTDEVQKLEDFLNGKAFSLMVNKSLPFLFRILSVM